MPGAFEMANAAEKRITANPVDQNTVDMLGHLYRKENADIRGLLNTRRFLKTINVLRSILGLLQTEVYGEADSTDVVSASSRDLSSSPHPHNN
jgi:hypothetical protein